MAIDFSEVIACGCISTLMLGNNTPLKKKNIYPKISRIKLTINNEDDL